MGSEMCIRDSVKQIHVRTFCLGLAHARLRSAPLQVYKLKGEARPPGLSSHRAHMAWVRQPRYQSCGERVPCAPDAGFTSPSCLCNPRENNIVEVAPTWTAQCKQGSRVSNTRVEETPSEAQADPAAETETPQVRLGVLISGGLPRASMRRLSECGGLLRTAPAAGSLMRLSLIHI